MFCSSEKNNGSFPMNSFSLLKQLGEHQAKQPTIGAIFTTTTRNLCSFDVIMETALYAWETSVIRPEKSVVQQRCVESLCLVVARF